MVRRPWYLSPWLLIVKDIKGELTVMLTDLIDIYCFTLDTLFEVFILCSLYNVKLRNTNRPVAIILIYLFLGTIFSYVFPDAFCAILLFPMSYISYKLLYQRSHSETMLGYILSYIYIVAFQDIFYMAFSKLEINDCNIQALIGQTGSFAIGILLLKILPVHKLYIYIIRSSIYIKCTIVNLALMYVIEVFASKYTDFDTTVTVPLLFSFAVVVFFSDYLLIRQQLTISRQQESLEIYQTYEPMMNNLIQDIQRRQHDFANELNAIQMIACTYSDYPSLSKALNQHIDDISRDFHHTNLVKLNMKVLAGFLYTKLENAKKMNKTINIQIRCYDLHSHMPEYELIKVAGILIDNAIEAIDSSDDVSVEIDSDGERITFATINKGPVLTSELIANMMKMGYTTKTVSSQSGSKRGYGLYNAKQLLDSYGGELYIENPVVTGDTLIRFEIIV